MQERRALGKGLSSLIPMGKSNDTTSRNNLELAVEDIIPNKDQPRKLFDKAHIDELANSIEEKGILQPLLVRKIGGGKYELIAGERRLRAAKQIRLERVPVIIKEIEDDEVLEIALIENIQRENLNPVEEALAYKELLSKYQYTQDELAKRIGKDRTTITNFLRLLKLPETVRQHIISGEISMGHARALAVIENKEFLEELVKNIIEKGLSVRDIENLLREMKEEPSASVTTLHKLPEKEAKDNPYQSLERDLVNELKTKIQIKGSQKKGKMIIHYHSENELDLIVQRLQRRTL